jgi:hypothetical protein
MKKKESEDRQGTDMAAQHFVAHSVILSFRDSLAYQSAQRHPSFTQFWPSNLSCRMSYPPQPVDGGGVPVVDAAQVRKHGWHCPLTKFQPASKTNPKGINWQQDRFLT